MPVNLAVVMDPISSINFKKDTTLALLLEAQRRDWSLSYLEQKDLFVRDGVAFGNACSLQVFNDPKCWYQLGEKQSKQLDFFDVILMRKDPPFDMEYIYTTYILEFAKAEGVRVINDPQGLRDANEKLFAQWFPQCMPTTIVTKDGSLLRQFIKDQKEVVLKPLHSMGGGSIFHLKEGDHNINVVIEVLTQNGLSHIMAQRFIPSITEGDKRIFMIYGKPIPYALARLPKEGEIRGNLAAGGNAKGVELTTRDYYICEQVSKKLLEKGLVFVGLDVIGEYLTEINVTSPTCVRELEPFYDIDIAKQFFDELAISL
ncbi:MAG: glutathione synthase [Gammaproteobacteria bacterium]|nr:glutathione synthase [Gammaproteobacteria bacterium]